MLETALAFVPLLAGYIFVSVWYRTSYLIRREDSQKVYFRAAFWGIWLFLLSFSLMTWVRPEVRPLLSFLNTWHEQVILTDGKTVGIDRIFWLLVLGGTLILGTLGGYFLNWLSALISTAPKEYLRLLIRLLKGKDSFSAFFHNIYNSSKREAVRKAIFDFNSDLELLLLRAMDELMPVSITLSHGKVYVGHVVGAIEPGEKREALRILPLVSGYRNGARLKLTFTTSYIEIYQKFEKNKSLSHLRPELFEVVFPLSEVKSINLFDINAYNAFQQSSQTH